MNRRIYVIAVFLLFACFAFNERAVSWEGDPTHKDITEYAAKNSVLSVTNGDYLKNIGFEKGLEEPLEWGDKSELVKEWLAIGSALEDAGSIWEIIIGKGRSENHFHNPLKEWGSTGLDGGGMDKLVYPCRYMHGQTSLSMPPAI